jgi:membrane dipeptidase
MKRNHDNAVGISREEILNINSSAIIFDMHIDPLVQATLFGYEIEKEHSLDWKPEFWKNRWAWVLFREIVYHDCNNPLFNHVDLFRMRRGGYNGAAFGMVCSPDATDILINIFSTLDIFEKMDIEVDAETIGENFEKSGLSKWLAAIWTSNKGALANQLAKFHELVKDESFIQAKTPEDVYQAKEDSKIAGFPGVEGVHCLQGSQEEQFRQIETLFNDGGVRYITLHHLTGNDAGECGYCPLAPTDEETCLKEFGKQVVRKMHQVGMMVDLAHTNKGGILDACAVQDRLNEEIRKINPGEEHLSIPLIASHTACRAAFEEINSNNGIKLEDYSLRKQHAYFRGLHEASISAIARTGGVIGVMLSPFSLRGEHKGGLEDVAKHVLKIKEIIDDDTECAFKGEDCIAFGSDFDGWIPSIPTGMKDASSLGLLTEALLKAKLHSDVIKKMYGQNFLRAWGDALKAAEKLRALGLTGETQK